MVIHSSILAWRIPWTEEPGDLQSIGQQTVGHDFPTKQQAATMAPYSQPSFVYILPVTFCIFIQIDVQTNIVLLLLYKCDRTIHADLEKAKEPEIKLPTSIGAQKNQEHSRKTSTSALLIMPNTLTVQITTNQTVGNSARDGNTRPPHLPHEKSVCRSRSNSQTQTCNNRLVPNWESSMSRLYIVTLLI